jgi:hypothetical protein
VIAEDVDVVEEQKDSCGCGHRPTDIPVESKGLRHAIDEIIASETTYLSMLDEFARKFIHQVRPIVNGNKGETCKEALQLSRADFEIMFGERLASIIAHSGALVEELSSVSLRISGPMPGGGRPGLVALAMKDSAARLGVYSPYVSSHPASIQLLQKTTSAARSRVHAKGRSRGGSFFSRKAKHNRNPSTRSSGGRGSATAHLTFEELWDEEAEQSKVLYGQSLQSLMIMPVQRVPRHKMLLEQALKYMDPEHPAYALMEETTDKYRTAARSINEELRKHEKLLSMFGKDENLRPAGAITTESGKITNTY